ncbi:Hypothetical predicted protein [Olea europaea subsp. europaea]|uniref:Protein LURP-one-related 5-like n=1 Tax=Olea europaea subsp. europaea TaxID=158383 RepID=A0A8S0S643_OLEEU|nr:Hypothetical predicted protein [Olea europaea subsp. europaea]
MSRIHPTEKFSPGDSHPPSTPSLFTLWKRSTMNFQGTDGFTVFDHRGKLAFRVENYARNRCFAAAGGLLLMDGSGKPLLTVKPKALSMKNQWNGYRGELDCSKNATPSRLFTMRRPSSSLIHTSACEAEIHIDESKQTAPPDFKIEGSFGRRNCKITRGTTGEVVAKISRKTVNATLVLSNDVFTLTVQPCMEPELVMAFVIILDRICIKPFSPLLCS